jgi:uroporphyrinogen decarboxylase
MTESLDIVLQGFEQRGPERVPTIPLVGLFSSAVSGYSVIELLRDSDKQARSQLMALRKLGYDGVTTCMDLTAEAEALGAHVAFQDSAFPYLTSYPIKEPAEFSKLELPLIKACRLKVFVDTTRQMARRIGRTHLVSSYAIGPFTLAGQLMGAEPFLELAAESPEEAAYAVKECRRIIEPYVDEQLKAGSHNIIILEPTGSSSVISPDWFAEFCAPHLKSLISFVRSEGAKATLHICGNTAKILDAMRETGADALSLDSVVSLANAYKKIQGRCTIIGNVDTTLLLNGSQEEVVAASRNCIEAVGGIVGGYVLSSGCDMAIETPVQNVDALVNTAKNYGLGSRSR